jgi:hypothetical protein
MNRPFESKLHTELVLLATKVLEMVCVNPHEKNPLKRIWRISREIDYSRICLQ